MTVCSLRLTVNNDEKSFWPTRASYQMLTYTETSIIYFILQTPSLVTSSLISVDSFIWTCTTPAHKNMHWNSTPENCWASTSSVLLTPPVCDPLVLLRHFPPSPLQVWRWHAAGVRTKHRWCFSVGLRYKQQQLITNGSKERSNNNYFWTRKNSVVKTITHRAGVRTRDRMRLVRL